MEQDEIWKDIEGYEGIYMVSNKGLVKSFDKVVYSGIHYTNIRLVKGRIMKQRVNKSGYIQYCLQHNGRSKYPFAHRLVAQAFIPNLHDKPFVNHLDYNPKNNCVENLEWVTPKENTHHSYDNVVKHSMINMQHFVKWRGVVNTKPVIMMDKAGNYIREYASMRKASLDINGSIYNHISDHINNPKKYPSAMGYTWKLKTA